MFFRQKRSGKRTYLQLVENHWQGGKSQQRVIATVGRLDKIVASGGLESLVASATRFCKNSINYNKLVADDLFFTSHQVSRMLQVSPSTVVGWINHGKLEAFRTPGGHRRVRMADLRAFLEQNQLPIPTDVGAMAHRVFVVDDDALVIKAIQRSMARVEGCMVEVEGCVDGITALVLIGARHPDLVLLDIYMEGLDGFEVCRRLRQIPSLEGLKIVAMSAQPSEEDRARILECGATQYWAKPVVAGQIFEVLGVEARRGTRAQAG